MKNLLDTWRRWRYPAYRVRTLTLGEYRYEEDSRHVKVVVEALIRNPCFDFVLYANLKQWAPPHEKEIINEAKRQEIIQRLLPHISNNPERVDIVVGE